MPKLPALAAAAAVTASVLGGTAQAEPNAMMGPVEARTIAIGGMEGIAYYTVEPDGLRVVTTMVAGEMAFRVVSTLVGDQAVTLAVPGAEGEPAQVIEFVRNGDRILVSEAELVVN